MQARSKRSTVSDSAVISSKLGDILSCKKVQFLLTETLQETCKVRFTIKEVVNQTRCQDAMMMKLRAGIPYPSVVFYSVDILPDIQEFCFDYLNI